MGEDTVEIRPARREDRRRIEELLNEANGGHYPLIDELDSWIDDEVGQFCVAIADGSVCGCSRLARLAPGERAWPLTPSIVVGASCGRCSTIVWRCGGASARDITEVL